MKKMLLLLLVYFFIPFHALALTSKKLLYEFAENTYSQFGEDGILKEIFKVIGAKSKVAVEFGAWDGFLYSNTAALWTKNSSWKAVLIEGDTERYKDLVRNTKAYNVIPINKWVGIKQEDCLETLLAEHGITQEIDLLSIDVDGNDYHIFNSLKKIRPRVIVCEYNPTIPFHYDVYAPYAKDNNFGQSVAALNRIAEKKGYHLVALTKTNAIFVLEKEISKFEQYETDWRYMNVNNGYIVMVTTYDGKYAFIKNKQNVYVYGIEDEYQGIIRGDCNRWRGERIPGCYQVTNEAQDNS